MTITINPTRNEYTATSLQTVFSYTFKIFAATDLNVYQTPTGQTADDTTDIITSYTVTGLGDEDGGTVILNTGATALDLITIVSDIDDKRTTDYQNNGDFLPDPVNADFDRVVSLVKQLKDTVDRGVVLNESTQGTSPLVFPSPEAGKLLRWKSALDGFENVTVQGTVITQGSVLLSDIEDIATQRALGRDTAGAGEPEQVTIAEMLEWFPSIAQGDILFRGAAGFERLEAGTTGQFLKTLGAAADPSWAALTPGSTTVAGVYEKSTETENNTGSDDTRVPSVLGVAQVMDGDIRVAKVMGAFDGTAGTPAVSAHSIGVTSITDTGTGDYTVNMSVTFDGLDYFVLLANSNYMNLVVQPASASSFTIKTKNSAAANIDSDYIVFFVYGVLA